MNHPLRRVGPWVGALLLAVVMPAAAKAPAPYLFAVLPSVPPVATYTAWTPFVERLGRDTGLAFNLKVYEKMSDFEQDLARGAADFVFVSPLQAVVAHQVQGYQPLVRGSSLVSAEIFVRTDSPIRAVGDLTGKRIAFVGNKNL